MMFVCMPCTTMGDAEICSTFSIALFLIPSFRDNAVFGTEPSSENGTTPADRPRKTQSGTTDHVLGAHLLRRQRMATSRQRLLVCHGGRESLGGDVWGAGTPFRSLGTGFGS